MWLSFLLLPSCRYCALCTVLMVLSRTTVFLQYASTTTDLPSTTLWHCIVQYCVEHIILHHDYLCTSTVVQLLSTNNYDTVLQYTHWLHYTGAELLHDMYCTLVLYHCMTCAVHWCCTTKWHVLAVHRQVGAVLVVICIVSHAHTYLLALSLLASLCCDLLIRRHATNGGVVFLACCVWMSNYFFLLACFDWVWKAICP